METSDIYRVTNCPIPTGSGNHHEGVDALLSLMGSHGLKFHRTDKDTNIGGPNGLIDESDVVLIKVNAQWKYRGCTNSDVTRGLIQTILEHPEGFDGEIVLFENGQSGGSLDCDTMWGGRYPDMGVDSERTQGRAKRGDLERHQLRSKPQIDQCPRPETSWWLRNHRGFEKLLRCAFYGRWQTWTTLRKVGATLRRDDSESQTARDKHS